MVKAIPDGCEGYIPHLVINGCAAALEFYAKAFGAEEAMRMPSPDGRIMHAEMIIGGKFVYLADDFPEYCGGKARSATALGGSPVTIHRYVENVDAAIARATEAGAIALMPPTDMFWGDRYGMVVDPYGHCWSFATHTKDLTPEQIGAAAAEAFKDPGSCGDKS
jgi:uncharacterized glyoxalase superfamily protein PhnB